MELKKGMKTSKIGCFHSSQNGFLTTANTSDADFEDLHQSRIMHLPMHKKIDLAGKIDMVVVFQAIEIDRLSNEIECLRITLKDSEWELRNYENYYVQIRELTERCHELYIYKEAYQEQIEHTNQICENLYHENEDLKKHTEDDLQELYAAYARLQEEAAAKQKENYEKNTFICKEIVRLNYNLLVSYNKLLEKHGENEHNLAELKKLGEAMQEMQRLGKRKDYEIEELGSKLQKLLRESSNSRDGDSLMKYINKLYKETKELYDYLYRLKGYRTQLKKYIDKLQEYNRHLYLYNTHLQQYNARLQEKDDRVKDNINRMQEELADLRKQSGLWEIEEKNWKEKSVRWQEEKEKAPRLQSSQSVSSSQGMQDKMARLEQDNSSLKNEISQLYTNINNLQMDVSRLSDENKRLIDAEARLRDSISQIKLEKGHLSDENARLQSENRSLQDGRLGKESRIKPKDDTLKLQKENNRMQSANEQLERYNNRLQSDNKNMVAYNSRLKTENKNLLKGSSRLSEYPKSLGKYSNYLYEDNKRLQKYNNKLQYYNSNLQKENRKLADKYARWQKDNNALLYDNANLQYYISKLYKTRRWEEDSTALAEENAHLQEENARLADKNARLQEDKNSLLEDNGHLQKENARLQEESARLKEKGAKLQQENANLPQLQSENNSLQQKVSRLQEDTKSLNSDNTGLHKENTKLQEYYARLQKYNARLQKEDVVHREENSNLREENAHLQDQLSRLQYEVQGLQNDGYQMQNEYNRYYNSLRGYFNALQDEFTKLENDYGILEYKYASLQAEHQGLQKYHQGLMHDHNSLDDAHNQLQNAHISLYNELNGLQQYHHELQCRLNELQNKHNYLQNKHNTLQSKYNSLYKQNKDLQQSHYSVCNEHKRVQNELNNLQKQYNKLHDYILTNLKPRLESEIRRKSYLEECLAKVSMENQQNKGKQQQMDRDLAQLQSRIVGKYAYLRKIAETLIHYYTYLQQRDKLYHKLTKSLTYLYYTANSLKYFKYNNYKLQDRLLYVYYLVKKKVYRVGELYQYLKEMIMRYEEAGDEIVGLKNTLTELESLRKRDEEYFTKKVEEMNNYLKNRAEEIQAEKKKGRYAEAKFRKELDEYSRQRKKVETECTKLKARVQKMKYEGYYTESFRQYLKQVSQNVKSQDEYLVKLRGKIAKEEKYIESWKKLVMRQLNEESEKDDIHYKMLACLALNEKLYENIVELHGVIEELADTNVRILTEKNAANSSDDEFEYEISSVRRFGNLSDKSKQTSAREMPDYRFSYDERNMDKDIRQSAGRYTLKYIRESGRYTVRSTSKSREPSKQQDYQIKPRYSTTSRDLSKSRNIRYQPREGFRYSNVPREIFIEKRELGTSRNTREIDYKSPIDYRSPTTPQTGRDNSKIGASEIMIKPWQNDQLPNTTDTTLEARNTPDSAEKSKYISLFDTSKSSLGTTLDKTKITTNIVLNPPSNSWATEQPTNMKPSILQNNKPSKMVTDSLIRTSVQSTGIPKSYGIDKAKGQVQMQAQLVSTAPIKSKGDILGASRVKFEENGGFPKSRFSGDVGYRTRKLNKYMHTISTNGRESTGSAKPVFTR